jgi:hypothetical protein
VLAGLTGAPGPVGVAGPSASPAATSPTPATSSISPGSAPGQSGPNYGGSIGRGSAPYEGWASLAVAFLLIGALAFFGVNLRLRARAAEPGGRADADGSSDG